MSRLAADKLPRYNPSKVSELKTKEKTGPTSSEAACYRGLGDMEPGDENGTRHMKVPERAKLGNAVSLKSRGTIKEDHPFV